MFHGAQALSQLASQAPAINFAFRACSRSGYRYWEEIMLKQIAGSEWRLLPFQGGDERIRS